MAFHGSRGSSRGRGRGNGIGKSNFRGRGRGGYRGGRGKPIFDSVRLAQQKERDISEETGVEVSDIGDRPESQDGSSSEDDEAEAPTLQPFSVLMQSFAADSVPQIKRRKLTHDLSHSIARIEEDTSSERIVIVDEDADYVAEPEEGPESAVDDLLEEGTDDGKEDFSDPFETHFAHPDIDSVARRLESLARNRLTVQKLYLPQVGKAIVSIPQDGVSEDVPGLGSISTPRALRLKKKLEALVLKYKSSFDAVESYLAPLIFDYQDVLYCERTWVNSESLRMLACLHAVNHVFKTRDRVIKNNARIAKEERDDLELRDQGFTRPKVLMILPTRGSCVQMVQMITSLCEPEQEENRKRFNDSYAEKEEKFSEDKPEDFRELFGGNDDDMFRLGLKFTRKTMKYFSQFYNSDIIFASPLGLKLALEGKDEKKGDYDYLSSIEMVIVDQADALLMQNWEHMEYIFDRLNLQPKDAHGCDFSRVRSWSLDNNSKYFRQTIAFTAFNTPELNTLFYQHSKNWAGKIKINDSYPGAIQILGLKIRQTFSRLESPSFATDPDARFSYFTTAIIPSLTRHAKNKSGTLIFIPSYLDFVRVRNYFATSADTSNLSFGNISEYTSVQDVARARSHFFSGRHGVLLYTERAHHFRRYQLRGVKKVIMYGLPDNPVFYNEIVGGYLSRSVQEGKLELGEGAVRVIFSSWDVLKLERIVGTERVGKMIKDKGDTFEFL